MPEQQLLKPTEWSYCDCFWADKKDTQGNSTMAGFELLLQKQLKGKGMQKEMSEFVQGRRKIEEKYTNNLAKLSQNLLAAQEEGFLGEAWVQVKKSLADEAEVYLKFSTKLHSYTQLWHEMDMFNKSTVEPVDQLLQKVEWAKDRELWVREHKMGNICPVDMEI
ncbi:Growth arrest-specific protein 7 [Sciurus carolinensis]|uniref:Growth arrest-specific protein 7 n=1 Tax=Sciurus carolinensis TaxID=30640 RepID=A0AA41MD74_SCICA|nr:Growth arrest-specific protein 7 [Sciurus carolinensis]